MFQPSPAPLRRRLSDSISIRRRGHGIVTRKAGTQTLERGLELLELAVDESLTLAELTRRSGLPRGVAYRLVSALAGREFLAQGGNGRFRGGPALLRLSHRAGKQTDIATLARPYLDSLSEKTGLSAFLGRRDGDDSVHLLRAHGNERVSVTTQPGSRRLLPETGMGKALLIDDDDENVRRIAVAGGMADKGKALLADLAAARSNDVVLQRGPPPDSIHSVAAPVRNQHGEIIAAINVAAAAVYMSDARMAELAPQVRQAADELGAALASQP
ncbi:MAG: transcriptional regulator [Sphingomonas sp.]|nr:transcriptional regulator [Sphingomonas sp.]